ncbi:MAG: DUF2170 family protein [Plesiomonas sp.]
MKWQYADLQQRLSTHTGWDVEAHADTLLIRNDEGLEAYLAISGEQILVESLLFSTEQVADIAGLNATILRTHQLFPLSTIAISTINNAEYYMAFGALSSHSSYENIDAEIATLFRNIAAFIDLYDDYLK